MEIKLPNIDIPYDELDCNAERLREIAHHRASLHLSKADTDDDDWGSFDVWTNGIMPKLISTAHFHCMESGIVVWRFEDVQI